MCGIAGVVHWDGRRVAPQILQNMADSIVHRGPDEEGFYFNRATADADVPAGSRLGAGSRGHEGVPRASVGLAHRRLSIIDLSGGQQPMSNEDGTVWIVFNGEIYNFQVLRTELLERGHRFRTRSDTEVIVHAYEEW